MRTYSKFVMLAAVAAASFAASSESSFAGAHPLLPPLSAKAVHPDRYAVWPWPIDRTRTVQEAKIRITITIG